MQNARLSELEKLLAKSSVKSLGRGKASDLKSSEEFNSLKEENRVVSLTYEVRGASHYMRHSLTFVLRQRSLHCS
jgi:hypothetical protein